MGIWRRFWTLNPSSRVLVTETAITLVATKAGLRLLGLRGWKAVLDFVAIRAKAEAPAEAVTIESARRIADLQQAVVRHMSFIRPNCLEQALTLMSVLKRCGILGELRIGARKTAHQFEAHAWIEVNGIILSDPNDDIAEFTPFEGVLARLELQGL